MENEPETQSDSELRGPSRQPSPRVRLPGYDESFRRRRRSDDWPDYDDGPPPRYRGYPRDSARRTSTWTAAALIAGVAATTGYLAHSIPVTSASTPGGTAGTGTSHGTVSPSAPNVHGPVVTSGGSGAAGAAGGGGGGN
jgi:hypothetical protein